MRIEENVEARKRKSMPPSGPNNSRFSKRKYSGRFENYTPLNTSREVVLQEVCNPEHVQLPSPKQSHLGVDPMLQHSYHHNIKHNTEDCSKVHDILEELVWSKALSIKDKHPRQTWWAFSPV